MKKKIPKFKSEKEEAQFWDTHSPLDYKDTFSDIKESIEFDPVLLKRVANRRAERKRFLTIRIGQRQVDLTKVIAKEKGLGYQTLMRMWVIEGIHKELKGHPEFLKFIPSK